MKGSSRVLFTKKQSKHELIKVHVIILWCDSNSFPFFLNSKDKRGIPCFTIQRFVKKRILNSVFIDNYFSYVLEYSSFQLIKKSVCEMMFKYSSMTIFFWISLFFWKWMHIILEFFSIKPFKYKEDSFIKKW